MSGATTGERAGGWPRGGRKKSPGAMVAELQEGAGRAAGAEHPREQECRLGSQAG